MDIIGLIIFWIIGSVIAVITSERVRDYKDYENPQLFLILCVFLCITMSWAFLILNWLHKELYVPTWIYHNCYKNSKITFEDTDYDKDGNVMEKYNSENFGHRETYRVYTCRICGKVTKERLQ